MFILCRTILRRQAPAGLITACLLVLGDSTAIALENDFTEDDFLADIPVVLSASRLSQPKSDSPVSTTIIDREAIEASGAVELAEVMRLVPGFQVAHVNGNSFAVTYHGLTFGFPRKFQVLVDGRSVYRPMLSNVDWATLGVSLENVDRIEVVRGPNTPAYGANAVLGTINIITRQPFEDNGTYFKILRGSLKTHNVMLRQADSLGELDYRITARHISDDGFDNVSDSKNIDDMDIRTQYSLGKRHTIDANMGYIAGEMGVGQIGSLLDPARSKEVKSYHAYMRWTQSFANNSEFYVQLFHNWHEQHDTFSNTISGFLNIPPAQIPLLFGGQPDQLITLGIHDGVAKRTELELQHSTRLWQSLRLVWGGSIRDDRIKGRYVTDRGEYVSEQGGRLFFNGEWQVWDPLLINMGFMLEQSRDKPRHYSPRLAINYRLNKMHSVRISGTRAHRAPSLFEANNHSTVRFNDGQLMQVFYSHDPNLQAEKMLSYEAAYLAEITNLNLLFDIKLFREKLTNIIVAPRDLTYSEPFINDGARVWSNNGYADTRGVEFQLSYQPWIHTRSSLQYAYAETSGVLLNQLNPDRATSAVDNVPAHTISFFLKHNFNPSWWGSVMFHRVSAMEWDGDGDQISDYSRWDIQLLRKLHYGLDSSAVSLIAHNVLDQEYKEFRQENTFRRRVYLKFTTEF